MSEENNHTETPEEAFPDPFAEALRHQEESAAESERRMQERKQSASPVKDMPNEQDEEEELPPRSKKKTVAAWICALAVLCGLLGGGYYFNEHFRKQNPDTSSEGELQKEEKAPDYVLYLKDNALWYRSLQSDTPLQLSAAYFDENDIARIKKNNEFINESFDERTSSFFNTSSELVLPFGTDSNSCFDNILSSLQQLTAVSPDGKAICYPMAPSEGTYSGVTLMYRSLEHPEEPAVIIDDKVRSYQFYPNSQGIAYVRTIGKEGNAGFESNYNVLYTSGFMRSQRIASGVSIMDISPDGSRLFWRKTGSGSDLCVSDNLAELPNGTLGRHESLLKNVTKVLFTKDDFSEITWLSETYSSSTGTAKIILYSQNFNTDAEATLIAQSENSDVLNVGANGSAYFVKNGSMVPLNLNNHSDYVTEGMEEADAEPSTGTEEEEPFDLEKELQKCMKEVSFTGALGNKYQQDILYYDSAQKTLSTLCTPVFFTPLYSDSAEQSEKPQIVVGTIRSEMTYVKYTDILAALREENVTTSEELTNVMSCVFTYLAYQKLEFDWYNGSEKVRLNTGDIPFSGVPYFSLNSDGSRVEMLMLSEWLGDSTYFSSVQREQQMIERDKKARHILEKAFGVQMEDSPKVERYQFSADGEPHRAEENNDDPVLKISPYDFQMQDEGAVKITLNGTEYGINEAIVARTKNGYLTQRKEENDVVSLYFVTEGNEYKIDENVYKVRSNRNAQGKICLYYMKNYQDDCTGALCYWEEGGTANVLAENVQGMVDFGSDGKTTGEPNSISRSIDLQCDYNHDSILFKGDIDFLIE